MTNKIVAASVVLALLTGVYGAGVAQGFGKNHRSAATCGSVVTLRVAVVTGAEDHHHGRGRNEIDTSNSDGQFLFPLLTPGFYSVKVEKGSFKTADVKGVEVVTGKPQHPCWHGSWPAD